MGTLILKCNPDEDLYCEWSSVVDNVTRIGTRAEIAEVLNFSDHPCPNCGYYNSEERLKRADATGSSSLDGDGDWRDGSILVMNLLARPEQGGTLKRQDLAAYCRFYLAEDIAAAEALLTPLEWDE